MHDRHPRRGDHGFTLVELLVVVLIIGILATIAIPAFFQVRERAWSASAKSDARSMSKIITSAQADGVEAVGMDTIAELVERGYVPSPNLWLGICWDADGSAFALGARHANSTAAWIVDFEGRLTESSSPGVTASLVALNGCDGPGDVDTTDPL